MEHLQKELGACCVANPFNQSKSLVILTGWLVKWSRF